MMLEQDLQSLGLSEKEARVYLAALELGPAPVRRIAEAARLPRPTCYVQITALAERGLVSSTSRGRKRVFSAEPPEALLSLFRKEAEAVASKEQVVSRILPELKSRMPEGDLPAVRIYEGLAGLEAMRRELLAMKKVEFYTMTGTEKYHETVDAETRTRQLRELAARSAICKAIVSGKKAGPILPEQKYLYERYCVSPEKYPFPGEVAIFGDNVGLISFEKRPIGVIIQNREIARAMLSLFHLAFERAKMFERLDRE